LLSVPVSAQAADVSDVSYSGDDLYDPAAGGLLSISLEPVPLGGGASTSTFGRRLWVLGPAGRLALAGY